MNILKTLILLFAILGASVAVARDLGVHSGSYSSGSKSSKKYAKSSKHSMETKPSYRAETTPSYRAGGSYNSATAYSSATTYHTAPTYHSATTYSSKSSKSKHSKKTKPSSSKGSKLSNRSPTMTTRKSTKKGGVPLVGIPTLTFDEFGEDDNISEFGGLQVTGMRASATSPAADGGKAGVPNANTITFTAPAGRTFSLVSASMATSPPADPVTVRGFNEDGVEIVSEVIDLSTVYETYDLSAFANVSEVSFNYPGPSPAETAIDNLVFV
eukprot:scaffold6992_cov102-Cylindrotheca_fusiformis.AAC.5